MSLKLLAQTETYTTTDLTTQTSGGSAVGGVIFLLLSLLITIVLIVGLWKTFQKAGKPGWAAIIPIYNAYVLLKIAGRPGWWLLLFLIPFVNFIIGIIVGMDVAKKFGYGDVFGAVVCGVLGIGYAIIGFSSATYQGGQVPGTTSSPSATN